MKKLLISLLLISACTFPACTKKKKVQGAKAVPVHMARAEAKDVPYYIATVGHMEAYEIVNIMGQVDGTLMKTYFADGADVKKGDLLYLIDQRTYLADLEKAEGELDQNTANRNYSERTAERNSQLVQDEYISQDDYDSLITQVLANDGLVKQSQADVENAKINLGYTTIYSPLDARAGFSLVDDGNLILESAETTLVTLNQISPIYATFFVTGKDLPKVQRYQKQYGPLDTIVKVDDPEVPEYQGKLTFIDNGIDLSTGMIQMKATLPNEDKILWPNQYIQIKLILDTIENAVLVPFEAVQNSAKGKYVFVIKGNQTVEKRAVTTGQMQANNTIVIEKGLKVGEKVVTEGQINLYDGAKVAIVKKPEDDS